MTKYSETLLAVLIELHDSSTDIQASAIVSTDGLLMAAQLDKHLDEDSVSAMTMAIHAQAGRVVREMRLNALKQVLIRGNKGYAIMIAAGDYAILSVMFKKNAQLGYIFLCCNRIAKKIAATGIAKPSPRMGLVCLKKAAPTDDGRS